MMNSRIALWTLSAIVALGPFPRISAATTWHVGPDGDGTDAAGFGTTPTNPVATLQYAINQAAPAADIRLLPGTHTQMTSVEIFKAISLSGDSRTNTTVFFPSNFTATMNQASVIILASNVTIRSLTVQRDQFQAYGPVINVADIWPVSQAVCDNIRVQDADIVGGALAFLLHPKNMVIERCNIYGQDAADNLTAVAFELAGFNGQVHLRDNYIDGRLAGNLGGTRVRRAFLVESRVGPERTVGTLSIESNILYNVREPLLWNHWKDPVTDKAAILFAHNTIDVTGKTPCTLFGYGSGSNGMEHLKFSGAVFRDNIFANIGGSACARADYQLDNFPRNFPLGGFTFENNLLYLHPGTAPVDSLEWPLATDPGWFSGAEFNTNGQPAGLRFDLLTDASPFADPDHANRNFALQPATAAGLAGYLAATDGSNIGAWQMPPAALAGGSPPGVLWNSDSNLTYQAQRSDSLVPNAGQDLGGPVSGNGAVLRADDTPPVPSNRYYRVILIP